MADKKKSISTQHHFCPNSDCDYYLVADAKVHALVGDGSHGLSEPIQDFFCQACRKKFTSRRHTLLYRLKTPTPKIKLALTLLALGLDLSALEEVLAIRKPLFVSGSPAAVPTPVNFMTSFS